MKFIFRHKGLNASFLLLCITGVCILTSLASCVTLRVKGPASMLNSYWKLSELNGREVVTPSGEKEAYMIFDSNHCIKGFSGCNKVEGSYYFDENKLSIEIILDKPTRMCPDMKTDQQFRQTLQNADRYLIDGNRLLLYKENIYLAKFVTGNLR